MDRTLDRSSDALDCFTHGLAHLMAVYGHERAAALAGQMALELLEGPDSDLHEWIMTSSSGPSLKA